MIRFVLKVTAVSAGAYLVAGAAAYQLLTKPFYVGPDALFARYLRSEAEPAQWAHVMRWQFPMLALRGGLIGVALAPFQAALTGFGRARQIRVLAVLFFVLLHFAAAAPSPSNLEGIVYLRPELMGVGPFLLTQPEMIGQSLLFALGTALWALRPVEAQ